MEVTQNAVSFFDKDPRISLLFQQVEKGDVDGYRQTIKELPDEIIALVDRVLAVVRPLIEEEYVRREYDHRAEALPYDNGSLWVLAKDEYGIVEFLAQANGWVSTHDIAQAVGGKGAAGRPRYPQWATVRCKKLVVRGILEGNERGEFRALRNALNVVEKR